MTTHTISPQETFTPSERLRAIVILLRPHQYYKNVLVFFGIFFSGNLFRADLWIPIGLAFLALCIVSSISYLVNDFRDREKDRHHPEKANRPFPSGKVSSLQGLLSGVVLAIILSGVLIFIPQTTEEILLWPTTPNQQATIVAESKIAFLLVLGALFITSQLYTLRLKEIVFADVITLSVNYVWRAMAGAVLISVSVSPWLIILCFITAMLLSLAKRKGDLGVLGESAQQHKQVFKLYTPELINQSLSTITAIELVAVFIYLIERHANETVFLVAALPLFSLGIFRFLFLVSSNSVVGRKAERLFFDKQILFTGLIIVALFGIAIYFPNLLDNLLGLPGDIP
jgi:4-hydroxybenzoate polyprenyltransferase